MLFVLTFLVFCAATAYISAPFWSRQSTPVVLLSPDVDAGMAAVTTDRRRQRVEAEAEIEILVARTRRRAKLRQMKPVAESATGGWQCVECGRHMARNDRFCASCGTARPA